MTTRNVCCCLVLFFSCLTIDVRSQGNYTLDSLISLGKQHHPAIQAALTQLSISENSPVLNLSDPQIMVGAPSGDFFTFGVSQDFKNPISYMRQKKVRNEQIDLAEVSFRITEAQIVEKVTSAYNELIYYQALEELAKKQDSIYNQLFEFSKLKFEQNEGSYFDYHYAESALHEFKVGFRKIKAKVESGRSKLGLLCGLDSINFKISDSLYKFEMNNGFGNNLSNDGSLLQFYYRQQVEKNEASLKLQKSEIISGLSLSYMNQSFRGNDPLYGFQLGVSIPIWFKKHKSLITQQSLEVQKSKYSQLSANIEYKIQLSELLANINSSAASIEYYESSGLQNAQQLAVAALKLFNAGEMSAVELVLVLQTEFKTKQNYFDSVFNYNQSLISLSYLTMRA